jgi:type IV secretory pathway ATPase VirB11/archaellum biosynthesis ATPase
LRTYSDKIKTVIELLDSTKMITLVKTYLSKYSDDRMLYRLYLFTPIIKPDFMYTKLMASYPMNGIEIDSYMVNDSEIAIFKFHDSVKYLYHLVPPEFKLSEEKYELIDLARQIITQHQPEKNDFIDPSRMRDVFYNISFELLEELAQHKKIDLSKDEFDELAKIVVRYSVGFGLIEVLLSDEQVQDVSVNSPYGTTPIYILHEKYDDCVTNIFPTKDESESWATKLRMLSGRPLDEANPILDTELELPNASIRTSSITKPLDPTGLAFSFRRHRDKPWTLPLFIKYKTINAFAAGLISFLVDGTRSFLIAGTRGSGKTSLLSSVLIEIMRRYRIITVEDTLELPVEPMRKLGYNIQPMKVSSALNPSKNEMDASNGIRSTLRLGDSSLIVGEVRSKEAIALYEAMRVGAAANVVAGTIHGDNPYGVFDRVVNDIGVPKISFKATDILVIVQPLKSADGLHKIRRVTQITEVRKDWENDPLKENGFVNLMEYDPTQDELVPTQELINGDSDILKIIAGNIKELASNWDAVLENITMRGKVKQYMVNKSLELDDPSLLEADFVILGNDLMHNSISEISEQYGGLDYEKIFEVWQKKYDYVVQNKANYQKQF